MMNSANLAKMSISDKTTNTVSFSIIVFIPFHSTCWFITYTYMSFNKAEKNDLRYFLDRFRSKKPITVMPNITNIKRISAFRLDTATSLFANSSPFVNAQMIITEIVVKSTRYAM